MEAVRGSLGRPEAEGRPQVIGFAALLAVGTAPWIYAVHVLVLGEVNTWAGHLAHAARNILATYPLAVLAVAGSRSMVGRSGMRAASVPDRLALAALITLFFTLCLVPATVAHPFLDPWLDLDSPAHALAGHRHAGPAFTDPLGRTLRGLRDALVGVPAAFCLALIGLAVPGWRWGCGGGPRPSAPGWGSSVSLAVPAASALVILGVGVTAVTLGGMEPDPEHAAAGRRATVRLIPASGAAEFGDLRLTIRSVVRAWHTHEPVAATPRSTPGHAAAKHRLVVHVTLANLGPRGRVFARQDVRLQAPTGKAWSPLAHGFPAIVLGAQEAVHSQLAFDVPASEARLALVWVADGREVRLPIGAARDAAARHGAR
jgi:hypothetical protein